MIDTYAQLKKAFIWVGYAEGDTLKHILSYRMLPKEIPKVIYCPNKDPPSYEIYSEVYGTPRVIARVNRLLIDSGAVGSYKIDQSILNMITVVVDDESKG